MSVEDHIEELNATIAELKHELEEVRAKLLEVTKERDMWEATARELQT